MNSVRSLTIYLNDHRAGAAAGTALARRLWHKNRFGPWASQLKDITNPLRRTWQAWTK